MKCLLILCVVLTSCAFAQQRQAALPQQKMCGDQARKVFREDNPTRPEHSITWEYTSHYEPRTKTCYIMTHFSEMHGKGFSISYSVYDAFEGRGYGSFIEVENEVMECSLSRPGHEKETCKTSDEFLRAVDKNFGIGP
jgi:hypothetical protein